MTFNGSICIHLYRGCTSFGFSIKSKIAFGKLLWENMLTEIGSNIILSMDNLQMVFGVLILIKKKKSFIDTYIYLDESQYAD